MTCRSRLPERRLRACSDVNTITVVKSFSIGAQESDLARCPSQAGKLLLAHTAKFAG